MRKVTPVEIGPLPEAGPAQANDTDKAYLSKALTPPATHLLAKTIPGDNLMTIVLSKYMGQRKEPDSSEPAPTANQWQQ